MFRYLGSPRGSAKLDRKSLASAAGTNQTPRTNAPSQECSGTFQEQKKKRIKEHLEAAAAATRTSVGGEVGVLHPGGGEGNGGGGVEREDGGREGRDAGRRRRRVWVKGGKRGIRGGVLAGKERAAWREM
jgi:hypothetical protein